MINRLRHQARWLAAESLFRSGLYSRRYGHSKTRAILMFHSILPAHANDLHLRNNTIAELERIVNVLQRIGSIVSVQRWLEDDAPRQFAITFDDGLLNNLSYAAPLLEKLQVPASYYINTPYVEGSSQIWPEQLSQLTRFAKHELHSLGQTYYRHARNRWLNVQTGQTMVSDWMQLSAIEIQNELESIGAQCKQVEILEQHRVMKGEEIKNLSQINGVSIGSHGVDHRAMTSLTETELIDSLSTSKTYLEQCTGRSITELAFPFGAANAHVCEIAKQVGYTHLLGVQKSEEIPDLVDRFGFYNHLPITMQLQELFSE